MDIDITTSVIAKTTRNLLGARLNVFLRGIIEVVMAVYKFPRAIFDMKSDLMSLLLSSGVGAVIGYVSFLLASPLFAFILAAVVAGALSFVFGKIVKDVAPEKRGAKWWLVNGGLCYFLMWFVVWVLALNLIK